MTLPPSLATAPDAPDAPTGLPTPAAAEGDWQPLPLRARPLFVLGAIPAFALPAAGLGFLLDRIGRALFLFSIGPLAAGALGLAIGAAFGIWRGFKHYRHTHWRLDVDGLAVRRGRLWQSETRVPASRVQHLDLKRGPLQRRRDLATPVVHTAGTRHSAVAVPPLASTHPRPLGRGGGGHPAAPRHRAGAGRHRVWPEAGRLRGRLSRQIAADDDAHDDA